MHLHDLPTPQVLIDRGRVRANIARMQAAARAHGVGLRPHAKTHKSPVVARWQVAEGALGICCAKIGEAEVFAGAGLEDIRLPYPVNPFNASRILRLQERARVSIIVDDLEVAAGWSEAMHAAGRTLDVLVKVDVGFHRCGIDPEPPDAVEFLQAVSSLPGLRLRGLLSHAGHAYHATSDEEIRAIAHRESDLLNDLADRGRMAGIEIAEISVGSTPTALQSLETGGITELRPGNYVYYDRSQVALGSADLGDCALTVMATVVSRPAADRIVLDCGSKTLTSDSARGAGHPIGYGLVFAGLDAAEPDDHLIVERLSEEHAVVRLTEGESPLKPGDRVRVLPNHSCVVSNMVDSVRLVEGLDVVETVPVAARGRIT